MPGTILVPPVALLTEVDVRAWSGLTLFYRGTDAVALPSFATDEGVYEDLLDFLNGRGSEGDHELDFDLQELWSGAGVVESGLDANDRLFIIATAAPFVVEPSPDNAAFGLDPAGQASVPSGGDHLLTAANDWPRGVIAGAQLTITPDASASFTFPSQPYRAGDLITLMRRRGLADLDDRHQLTCLEHLDNVATDAMRRNRWGLDAQGHVWTAWRTGTTFEPTWADDDFRALLGFTGDEVVQHDGLLDFIVATHPTPLALFPTRSLRRCRRTIEEKTYGLRLLGGGIAGNPVSIHRGWDVHLWVDGPVGSERDLSDHFTERFLSYARLTRPLTVYRYWGDPRRHLSALDVGGAQAAYDLLNTSELRRGRLRCLRHERDKATRTHDFNGQLDVRSDLRLRLIDNPEL